MMMPVPIDWVAAIYCLVGLGLSLGLWVVYDWRSARVWQRLRRQRVFRCAACEVIYRSAAGRRSAACPECGVVQAHLQF